jgi:hypothetical protein
MTASAFYVANVRQCAVQSTDLDIISKFAIPPYFAAAFPAWIRLSLIALIVAVIYDLTLAKHFYTA